jgi:hypothetical protein|tara:strand:+ start:77753 stop:78289 length:537 start_codon:yes stop_codon:yes gene_type:complete
MKKAMLLLAMVSFSVTFAQVDKNTNTEKQTVVTKTSVTDDKGTDTATKAVTQTKKEVLSLKDSDANQTNQSVVMKPIEVDTDVTYDYEGNRFKFLNQKDEEGYRLMTIKDNATNEEYAVIKPTSQNGYYIMSQDGRSSFGYFNADGNFVVERYDAKTDAIISEVYKLNVKSDRKKDKM